MEKEKRGVHEHHCCVRHGCKYGNDDCPVVSGETLQVYRCEDCPPKIKNNTLTIDKFIELSVGGWVDWLDENTIDKVKVTTDDGTVLSDITALQNELVDTNNRKDEIINNLRSIKSSKLYIRNLKIQKIKDVIKNEEK